MSGCAAPCLRRTRSDSGSVPFSDECPLTKNLVWRRAVSGDDFFALAEPVKSVLGSQVCSDGRYGKELMSLFEVRRSRSHPDIISLEGSLREDSSPRDHEVIISAQRSSSGDIITARRSSSGDVIESGVCQDVGQDLEELGFEFAEDEKDCKALQGVLDASREHRLLVKTIKNDGWPAVFELLEGPAFETPTTLLPAQGLGMRLFAEAYRASCGLIWDTKDVDLSNNTYMWPSGYFAKTEFNLNADGSLSQGREEALVTLEQLRAANDAKEFKDFLTGKVVSGCVMPYNEVLATVEGARLVGVFARSTEVKHLLLAMGVRDRLAQMIPQLGPLPLFLHDPENGVRPFTPAGQWLLVHRSLKLELALKLPYPLDLRLLQGPDGGMMNPVDQLRFHGKYGITEDCLHEVVRSPSPAREGTPDPADVTEKRRFAECAAFALLALDFAVDADNADSALSIVKNVAPLVFSTDSAKSLQGGGSDDMCGSPTHVPEPVAEPSVTLTSLLARSRSSGVKVAVGACLALESYTNGRSRQKVKNAITLLEEWLACATKMSFRLQSLMDEKKDRCGRMPLPSELGTFVSDRIISNRTFFMQTLRDMNNVESRLSFFQQLRDLASRLLHPCLRLHVLQGVLGLDKSYDRDTVCEVLRIAYDLVHTMDAASQ